MHETQTINWLDHIISYRCLITHVCLIIAAAFKKKETENCNWFNYKQTKQNE